MGKSWLHTTLWCWRQDTRSRKRSDLPRVPRQWVDGDSATRIKVLTPSSVPSVIKQAGFLQPGLNPQFLASPYSCLLIQPLAVVTPALWSWQVGNLVIWGPLPFLPSFSRTSRYPQSWDRQGTPSLCLGQSPCLSLLVEMKEQSKLRELPTMLILIIFVETTLTISKAWRYFQIISKHFPIPLFNMKAKCLTLIVKREEERVKTPSSFLEKT